MKIIFSTLLLACLTFTSYSQKETVYSIVKQPQSPEWYQKQFELWNKETETNPQNTEAWQNAYIALRMIKITSGQKTQEDLNNFIHKMQKAIPNTYEYHYLTYYNGEVEGDKYDKLYHHIEKAYKIDSSRSEIYPDLVSYNLIKGNKERYNKFCRIWFNSNSMSAGILNFAYNLLVSCEDESVLITNGDNDTYPLFLIQEALNFKPKVKVLNIYLLQKDEYRNRIFKELNIPLFDKKSTNFEDPFEFMKAITRHLEKELKIKLYYSSTTNPKIYEESKENVYVVGLTLEYSTQKFDNIALIKKNIEQNYKLDYISVSFYNDISQSIVYNTNNAYLTGFLILFNHYKESGDILKMQKLKNILTAIAQNSSNKEYILNYIKC